MDTLAGLLEALTTSAAQGAGADLWDALRAILRRPRAAGDEDAEISVLDALAEDPEDPSRVEDLKKVLEQRARTDPGLREALTGLAAEVKGSGAALPDTACFSTGHSTVHINYGTVIICR